MSSSLIGATIKYYIMIYIIGIIIYVLIAWFVYNKITSKWLSNSKAMNIYFSIMWILLMPLYIIYKIHKLL